MEDGTEQCNLLPSSVSFIANDWSTGGSTRTPSWLNVQSGLSKENIYYQSKLRRIRWAEDLPASNKMQRSILQAKLVAKGCLDAHITITVEF